MVVTEISPKDRRIFIRQFLMDEDNRSALENGGQALVVDFVKIDFPIILSGLEPSDDLAKSLAIELQSEDIASMSPEDEVSRLVKQFTAVMEEKEYVAPQQVGLTDTERAILDWYKKRLVVFEEVLGTHKCPICFNQWDAGDHPEHEAGCWSRLMFYRI